MMARSFEQPRWRSLAMQATMWLVFAATLGAAEMVSRHKRADVGSLLGDLVPIGSYAVQIPAGWGIDRESTDSEIIAEPGDGSQDQGLVPRLTISVSTQLMQGFRQALGYDRPHPHSTSQDIAVGLVKGRLTVAQDVFRVGAETVPVADLALRALLPDGSVLTIDLMNPGADDPAEDVKLIRAIAGSVTTVEMAPGH